MADPRYPRRVSEGRAIAALGLVGGHDPTGGAGVIRDVVTARALAPELRPRVVVSAWTAQGDGAPARAVARPWARVAAEVEAIPKGAVIKVGMVPAALVEAGLVDALRRGGGAWVVDPVLWASDGGRLGEVGSARALARGAALVTPNRPEAAALAGTSAEDPELLARVVEALEGAPVLLKDGHGGGREVRDRLWVAGEVHTFARPRLAGPDPRGTGCALATAIAVGMARGLSLVAAIGETIAWLDGARQRWRAGPGGAIHLPGAIEEVAIDVSERPVFAVAGR